MTRCKLCEPQDVLFESQFAYVRYDSRSLSAGHVIVLPRRHVADFFEMTAAEQGSVRALLNRAHKLVQERHRPDGYIIPRYAGDVPDPRGGVRCVLAGKS